jgi:tetratricopeptide (TPR) repeat protein
MLRGMRRYPEALAAAEWALRLGPAPPAAPASRIKFLGKLDRLAEARAAFERAGGPRSADLEAALGQAWFKVGFDDEAIGHLRRAIRLQPGHADAHAILGLALLATG